jgi:hypothetical protein
MSSLAWCFFDHKKTADRAKMTVDNIGQRFVVVFCSKHRSLGCFLLYAFVAVHVCSVEVVDTSLEQRFVGSLQISWVELPCLRPLLRIANEASVHISPCHCAHTQLVRDLQQSQQTANSNSSQNISLFRAQFCMHWLVFFHAISNWVN